MLKHLLFPCRVLKYVYGKKRRLVVSSGQNDQPTSSAAGMMTVLAAALIFDVTARRTTLPCTLAPELPSIPTPAQPPSPATSP